MAEIKTQWHPVAESVHECHILKTEIISVSWKATKFVRFCQPHHGCGCKAQGYDLVPFELVKDGYKHTLRQNFQSRNQFSTLQSVVNLLAS